MRGFSSSRRLRSSMANSTRPGTTGKYRSRPRSSEPALISASRDIAQGLFAQRLFDGLANRALSGAADLGAQLHRKSGDVDSVANGITLIGGVSLLEKIGDVIQDS